MNEWMSIDHSIDPNMGRSPIDPNMGRSPMRNENTEINLPNFS
jgi:hypothetical protein